jgi:alanine racemase
MDKLTESETKQKKQKMMMITTTTTPLIQVSPNSGRSQASYYSSFLQERNKIIATVNGAGVADGATSPVKNLSHYRLHRHSQMESLISSLRACQERH